jgi:DNA (cytosine-5)-methyltransferase 1
LVKFGDAFCGMGGFSLAAHEVFPGSQCVWAIDNDAAVSDTFLRNFQKPCRGDIRKVDADKLPDMDILFGGFPCQPFSQSGQWRTQIGAAEDRDNLFLDLVRILRAKRPGNFVFENVDNLLRMQNKDGSSVVESIRAAVTDAGYDVEIATLNAANYGVPQDRERAFFVGSLAGAPKFEFPGPLNPREARCIDDILEKDDVDEKHLIKNYWGGWKMLGRLGGGVDAVQRNNDSPVDTPRWKVAQDIYDDNVKKEKLPTSCTGRTVLAAIIYGDTPSGKARRTDKVYSRWGISPTIIAFSPPAVDSPQGLRKLTPRECARLQGFPEHYILPSNDHQAHRQIGNAVCVPVVANILKKLSL